MIFIAILLALLKCGVCWDKIADYSISKASRTLYSPTGSFYVVISSDNQKGHIVQGDSGPITEFSIPTKPLAVAISLDGTQIYVGGETNRIY